MVNSGTTHSMRLSNARRLSPHDTPSTCTGEPAAARCSIPDNEPIAHIPHTNVMSAKKCSLFIYIWSRLGSFTMPYMKITPVNNRSTYSGIKSDSAVTEGAFSVLVTTSSASIRTTVINGKYLDMRLLPPRRRRTHMLLVIAVSTNSTT